jgi:hypothetical protein
MQFTGFCIQNEYLTFSRAIACVAALGAFIGREGNNFDKITIDVSLFGGVIHPFLPAVELTR